MAFHIFNWPIKFFKQNQISIKWARNLNISKLFSLYIYERGLGS